MAITRVTKMVAGSYTATFNAEDLGETANGFEIRGDVMLDPVRADTSGDVSIDAIVRGVNASLSASLESFGADAMPSMLGAGSSDGLIEGVSDAVGYMVVANDLAKQTVLTPSAGLPENAARKIYTFKYSFPTSKSFTASSRLRVMPVNWMVFPDDDGVLYTTS